MTAEGNRSIKQGGTSYVPSAAPNRMSGRRQKILTESHRGERSIDELTGALTVLQLT